MEFSQALDDFDEHGYAVIPNAISGDKVAALIRALDDLTIDQPSRIHNVADIFAKHDEFLDLIDLPSVLPVIQELLGNNIWVNHSHYNINPPDSCVIGRDSNSGYGWHRDGGAINQDLPKSAPLLSIKVAFYLSDLTEPGRGETYVIAGSHKTDEQPPPNEAIPDSAIPVLVKPGSALLFDRRMIHSIRSENQSAITRKVVFIQYAFRWLCPVDAMTVDNLRYRCNPIRLQLLGLSQQFHTIDGAAGRSATYYPSTQNIPLAGKQRGLLKRLFASISRRIRQLRGTK